MLPHFSHALARADGTYARVLARIARIDVLVIDDWGLAQPRETLGDLRERERPAARGALTPSPYAFRLPHTPHELAHALAHATR